MITIRQTEAFATWFSALRDEQAVARISARLRRLALGNSGDVRPVGQGVSELRIDAGPGYRVYYKHAGLEIVLLLCGGDKSSQKRDIARALALAAQE